MSTNSDGTPERTRKTITRTSDASLADDKKGRSEDDSHKEEERRGDK
jgi:hypothetical protein